LRAGILRPCRVQNDKNRAFLKTLNHLALLLVSQINYTLTNFAEHAEKFDHDTVNCYLAGGGEELVNLLAGEGFRHGHGNFR